MRGAIIASGALAWAITQGSPAQAEILVPSRMPQPVIFAGECIWENVRTRGDDESFLETILGSAISRAVDGIGSSLEAAAAERTFVSVGALNLENEKPQCLQFWSGPLSDTAPTVDQVREWTGLSTGEGERLIAAGIRPSGAPALFVEFWLRPSSEGNYFAFTPTLLLRRASLETLQAPRVDRRLAFQMTIKAVNSDEAATSLIGPRRFGTGLERLLTPSNLLDSDSCLAPQAAAPAVHDTPSPTAPAPTAPTEPTELDCRVRGAIEAAWISNTLTGDTPVTLTLSVQETRPRNPALSFLSGLFGDNKDAITREVQERVLPGARRNAEQSEATARTTLIATARESFQKAETAKAVYCAGASDHATLGFNAAAFANLQTLANLHARQAGLPAPYATVVPVEDPAPLQSICQSGGA